VAVLATDFVNHTPPLPEARDQFIAAGVENHAQFPAGKYTIKNIVADGDMVYMYGNFEGAHTGTPFEGIKASGAKANFDFMLLFRMKDGKIAERWAVSDSVMGMLVPLGYQLVPPK
jgi:predicted ester cyclase